MSECVFAARLPDGRGRHAVLCCRRGSNVARGYVATAQSSIGSTVALPSPFACAAPFSPPISVPSSPAAPTPPPTASPTAVSCAGTGAAAFFAVGGVAGDLSIVAVVAGAPAALLAHTRLHTAPCTAVHVLAVTPLPDDDDDDDDSNADDTTATGDCTASLLAVFGDSTVVRAHAVLRPRAVPAPSDRFAARVAAAGAAPAVEDVWHAAFALADALPLAYRPHGAALPPLPRTVREERARYLAAGAAPCLALAVPPPDAADAARRAALARRARTAPGRARTALVSAMSALASWLAPAPTSSPSPSPDAEGWTSAGAEGAGTQGTQGSGDARTGDGAQGDALGPGAAELCAEHRQLGVAAALADPRRDVRRLWASPGGRYVAAADTLGRVLVVDTVAGCVVVRMLKGYRAAVCAWCWRAAGGAGGAGGDGGADADELARVYLAVHTPLRRIVDVWAVAGSAEPCARITLREDEVFAECDRTDGVALWSAANDTLRWVDVAAECARASERRNAGSV